MNLLLGTLPDLKNAGRSLQAGGPELFGFGAQKSADQDERRRLSNFLQKSSLAPIDHGVLDSF
jgi:hypothetical protein